jgi:predicted naringenin-chalcone synthase
MAYIHHIETVAPAYRYAQADICRMMQDYITADRKTARILSHIYQQSAIATRYSVLDKLTAREDNFYFAAQKPRCPTTAQRNERYQQEARRLFSCAARRVLARLSTEARARVRQVITVSCTGFFAPGPEHYVVQDSGLSPATARYHLGFMGCYAVFPALKMAQALCRSDPDGLVLVVAVELCTLHLQQAHDLDSLVSAAVFADGGAAVLVGASPPAEGGYRLEAFASTILPEAESKMAWTIGDSGFAMTLSSYVPAILESSIARALVPLFEAAQRSQEAVHHWAVHPGGRAILDKVQAGLLLCDPDLAASRKVLRDYGNMSSVTSLFVLKELLDRAASGERICAMAFGPGLTVETGLLMRV